MNFCMKAYRLSFLIFNVLSLIGLLSFSTELDVNQRLRTRIHQGLTNTCQKAVTRSAPVPTRSATRSASPRQDAVEQFSDFFGRALQMEWGVPYGHESDPNSFYFLKNDLHEGPAKLKFYEWLGYIWGLGEAPTVSPTWMQLAKNIRAQLSALGIPLSETFVPALVLYKKIGEKLNAQGQMENVFEYLFIDPISEAFPTDRASWTVLTKDVQFNIPFAAILQAMKVGKFPMMDANHDVAHFISFLRFPEFAKTLRSQLARLTEADITRGFKLRQYWLTESLSVLDPTTDPRVFLARFQRPSQTRSLAEVELEIAKIPQKKLLTYAVELSRYFESQLRDISGGNSNSAEKWYYLSESFGLRAQDLMEENLQRSEHLYRIRELADTYFREGPITLNANPKKMTNETATFNFNTFVVAQKLLALLLMEKQDVIPQLANWSREEALASLVKFVARTEWALTSKPVSYREWTESFIAGNMDPQSPLAQLLVTVFGHPFVSKYYLGIGAKRTE